MGREEKASIKASNASINFDFIFLDNLDVIVHLFLIKENRNRSIDMSEVDTIESIKDHLWLGPHDVTNNVVLYIRCVLRCSYVFVMII